MPLALPSDGVECYLSEEALVILSGVFDDIDWWRNKIEIPDDAALPDLADLIPHEDLPNSSKDRDALRRDLERLSSIVQDATLGAVRLAIASADRIVVNWDVHEDDGGRVTVTVDRGVVTIDLYLYCVHP